MESAGTTQKKLAEQIGTTQPAVSQWITGKKEPTDENLADAARHLQVSATWLRDGTPPMREPNRTGERADAEERGWAFREAPEDGGRDGGNANVWSFDPELAILVREVLQNSCDAARDATARVEVTFRVVRLTGADLDDYQDALKWDQLETHLRASAGGKQKFNSILRDGLEQIERKNELLLLVIDDRGTTGLTGPEVGDGKFAALCRDNLMSHKDGGTKGGAFGLGKAVLWRASRLSTVLFGSHLAVPEGERAEYRLFGRSELAWHECEDGASERGYQGPGWFGRKAEKNAVSYWGNRELAERLFLGRGDVTNTGTSACVIGFHDASDDRDRSPVELAKELVQETAAHFFPALVAGRLAVRVEVCESREQYAKNQPAFSQAVNPDEFVPNYARMLRAYRDGNTTAALGEKGEVAAVAVKLSVPGLKTDKRPLAQEHDAVLLVRATDEDKAGAEEQNHAVLFRGPGMVVTSKLLSSVGLGARPFQSLLVCGTGPKLLGPEGDRTNPGADAAGEQFLRTAEPPSHNEWKATPALKSEYAHGCVKRLEDFLKIDLPNAVRELVRPVPRVEDDAGPQSMRELFRIGSDAVPAERPRVTVDSAEVKDGKWTITAKVRLKSRKTSVRLMPAVYVLGETGGGTRIGWEALEPRYGSCTVHGKRWLVVPPNTRELKFAGTTKAGDHIVPASESCVVVDIHKVEVVKEAQS
jgi:transcriptional regulator with XRE-family HTH domain